jgi:hypothetical protein
MNSNTSRETNSPQNQHTGKLTNRVYHTRDSVIPLTHRVKIHLNLASVP